MKTLYQLLRPAVLAIGIGAALSGAAHAGDAPVQTINATQGRSMQAQGALLLDVREPEEYAQGHAPGSRLLPVGQLKNRLEEIRAYENKPVAVICRSGRRSAQAASILKQAGFKEVYNVEGGMNAWEKSALPITK